MTAGVLILRKKKEMGFLSLTARTDTDFYCNGKGTPYYLGIKEQNLCLCCTEIRGQPALQLKVSGCTANERSAMR